MHGFSIVDGFAELNECLAEMIKYIANEPSLGLYYVQQHSQNTVPNVINLNNHVVEKSQETTLHTEDLEDSIAMVGSVKECGFLIAEEMIKDIGKSLAIMSQKQPRRGLIHNPTSSFHVGRSSSWGPAMWGRTAVSSRQNYQRKDDVEGDKLPVSSRDANELEEEEEEEEEEKGEEKEGRENISLPLHTILWSLPQNFDEFKANKEAELEEWLEGTVGSLNCDLRSGEAQRHP
ncbi:hypothetical protein HS088_TW21G01646 [Tripterygium wilfordii]|uniref:Uncharacterized protein n=1 Tax=Tripterygium wilfordii TaxID=458696 RepID=A0A7J7C5N1_TRIWF|nr:hypothetical protein HS088_TW21G01646 [Tripterygium wilfordii]